MGRMDEHIAFLKEYLATDWGLEDGVRMLVAYCKLLEPQAPWELVESLDLARESRSFEVWLDGNLPTGQSRAGIEAFYFGLDEDATTVHLDGCGAYDPADVDCDWACEWVYRTEDDWTDSRGLQAFADISEAVDGEEPILLYLLSLGYLSLMVRRHATRLGKPVAVGFDEGDAFVLAMHRSA
jgi:hypothetical protein